LLVVPVFWRIASYTTIHFGHVEPHPSVGGVIGTSTGIIRSHQQQFINPVGDSFALSGFSIIQTSPSTRKSKHTRYLTNLYSSYQSWPQKKTQQLQ
jgi:hypothetical protein